MKDRERRPEEGWGGGAGLNESQSKFLSKWPLSQTTLQNMKSHKSDALEPTGVWMFLVMTREYSGTLTSAENQAQHQNSPKPESEALNFNQNEESAQTKIT